MLTKGYAQVNNQELRIDKKPKLNGKTIRARVKIEKIDINQS